MNTFPYLLASVSIPAEGDHGKAAGEATTAAAEEAEAQTAGKTAKETAGKPAGETAGKTAKETGMKKVVKIFSNEGAFIAFTKDGFRFSWGNKKYVEELLRKFGSSWF